MSTYLNNHMEQLASQAIARMLLTVSAQELFDTIPHLTDKTFNKYDYLKTEKDLTNTAKQHSTLFNQSTHSHHSEREKDRNTHHAYPLHINLSNRNSETNFAKDFKERLESPLNPLHTHYPMVIKALPNMGFHKQKSNLFLGK